jgi:sugar phosphate isomerase/epimerase
MKLALCAGSLKPEIQEGRIGIYEVFDIAVKYGFDGLEVREDLLLDKASDLPRLKSLSADRGVELIYAYMNWPVNKDINTMKNNIPQLIQRLDEAEKIGSGILKTGFGPIDDIEELSEAHLDVLKEITSAAQDRGIVLCLENSDKPNGSNAAALRDVMEAVNSPFMKITYDSGNFAIAGKDPISALETLAEHVAYVHLKDVKWGQASNTFMGNGNVDYQSIFGFLAAKGYKGYGCFEFSMNTARLYEIEKSFEYIHSLNK